MSIPYTNKVITDITVDVTAENQFAPQLVKQNDRYTREFRVSITNNGEELILPDTVIAYFNCTNLTNPVKQDSVVSRVEDNRVIVGVPPVVMEDVGLVECDIEFVTQGDDESANLKTTLFYLEVQKAANPNKTSIPASDEKLIDALAAMLSDKVGLNRLIANLSLSKDITAEQMQGALGTYPIMVLTEKPTTQTQGKRGQLGVYITYDGSKYTFSFYYCWKVTSDGTYLWTKINDYSSCVPVTRTIANLDLSRDITVGELIDVLKIISRASENLFEYSDENLFAGYEITRSPITEILDTLELSVDNTTNVRENATAGRTLYSKIIPVTEGATYALSKDFFGYFRFYDAEGVNITTDVAVTNNSQLPSGENCSLLTIPQGAAYMSLVFYNTNNYDFSTFKLVKGSRFVDETTLSEEVKVNYSQLINSPDLSGYLSTKNIDNNPNEDSLSENVVAAKAFYNRFQRLHNLINNRLYATKDEWTNGNISETGSFVPGDTIIMTKEMIDLSSLSGKLKIESSENIMFKVAYYDENDVFINRGDWLPSIVLDNTENKKILIMAMCKQIKLTTDDYKKISITLLEENSAEITEEQLLNAIESYFEENPMTETGSFVTEKDLRQATYGQPRTLSMLDYFAPNKKVVFIGDSFTQGFGSSGMISYKETDAEGNTYKIKGNSESYGELNNIPNYEVGQHLYTQGDSIWYEAIDGNGYAHRLKNYLQNKFGCTAKNYGLSGFTSGGLFGSTMNSSNTGLDISGIPTDENGNIRVIEGLIKGFDTVFLTIGGNDRTMENLEPFVWNLKELVKILINSNKNIILMSMTPFNDPDAKSSMEDIDSAIRSVVEYFAQEENGGILIPFVSNYQGMIDYSEKTGAILFYDEEQPTITDTLIGKDGLHPNDEGYSVVNSIICESLGINDVDKNYVDNALANFKISDEDKQDIANMVAQMMSAQNGGESDG